MMAIEREVIVITGASSGIGKALALQLAENNTVIGMARSANKLMALANVNNNFKPLVCDITAIEQTQEIQEQLVAITPYIDRVIINAGTCEYLDINQERYTDLFKRIVDVNFLGAVHTLDVIMPLLKHSALKRPHIIMVSSMATQYVFPKASAYGGSKAALSYCANSLRLDLAPLHIDVSVISPGFVETPLTDKNNFKMPFKITSQEAATRIISAIAKRKKHYCFPKTLYFSLKFLNLLEFFGFRPKSVH